MCMRGYWAIIAATCALLLVACTGAGERFRASGRINGHAIDSEVDSAIAEYYLERYLTGQRGDGALDGAIAAALASYRDQPLSRDALQSLARRTSVDFATLYLIKRLSERPENAEIQLLFWRETERLARSGDITATRISRCAPSASVPVVLFAPGWFYETQPETGGDFRKQRDLLESLDIDTQLIRTVDNGTVEENAAIIAAHIRDIADSGRKIILVSASKGGPEAAHALGHVLGPAEASPVKAWINVGGILKGSPLADWAVEQPKKWLTRLWFALQGYDVSESVPSMTTMAAEERWRQETIPEHVLVVNFVGVPLSGDIVEGAELGYSVTKRVGPNDGLTPIIDEIAHGGVTVVQVGLDHYYRDPALDVKTVALALTVLRTLDGSAATGC